MQLQNTRMWLYRGLYKNHTYIIMGVYNTNNANFTCKSIDDNGFGELSPDFRFSAIVNI